MSTMPLEQAIAVSRQVMSNVTAEQMSDPTPCASWDVSALINHMINAPAFFRAGVEGTPPAGGDTDHAAGDYLAAFDESAGGMLTGFQAEGALEKMLELPFGTMPGAALMGMAVNDTFTHAWDLAKATGQSTDLAPELAEAILTQARQSIQDAFRGPEGAPFGEQTEVPDDATAADRLAAFLGRQV